MQQRKFTPQTGQELMVSCVGVLLGISVGLKFADIDQRLPDLFFYHRAILTHGLLLPALLGWGVWRGKQQLVRGATIGFCAANAVHLSFDLFPRAWWGHALIHVFAWPLPPVLSWLWVAASIVVCLYLARFFARTIWDLLLASGGILSGFIDSAHEGLFFPLVAFLIAGFLAFLLPSQHQRTSTPDIRR